MTPQPTPSPTHLFAYGTLAPDGPCAAARGGWMADMVRGRLYDVGPYPALVDTDDPAAGWVGGFARAVARAELEGPLDFYEGVHEGLYRRVAVTTRGGLGVWVYVFARPLPPSARPIDRWDGRRFGRGGAPAGPGPGATRWYRWGPPRGPAGPGPGPGRADQPLLTPRGDDA